ncbi:VOC family protein [Labrys wisconsinensis]|uniref:Catechol 2,3-dioxygenase-like lactoylglutathione lyase family enzyme n=1 Tax=Labrys wisconsinensis TaxID=425677 RepID=A0ABU0JN85_9HYPH|nr:VOC family protein [Labrys wisconsinensis]MDQ0474602.1 catechol 2,3-dioxygenase-like lactoylglutathione lyase family enzyme [Labrys wisconsinensis]
MSETAQRARLNHVSIPARDLAESEAFYREILGCERVEAPNFGFPVCWLRLGDLQLHLQQVGPTPGVRTYQHFAVEVDDFTAAYRELRSRGAFEEGTRYADLWLLPSGELQMFVRDPSDNLFEIDHPDAGALDLAAFAPPPRQLADEQEQAPHHRAATLFLARREAGGGAALRP